MTERDPDKFLASLTDAFRKRLEVDSTVKPQFHYFEASKQAVSVPLCALDRLAAQFPISSQNTNVDLGKRQERNQVLFDFFSNASAVIESFCCRSYFVGSVLDPANFPLVTLSNNVMTELRKIDPKQTQTAYKSFEPQSAFTKRLQNFLDSNEYKLISSMRNLLVHRMVPGLTIQPLSPNAPHAIDLELWYNGEVGRCYGVGHLLRQSGRLNSTIDYHAQKNSAKCPASGQLAQSVPESACCTSLYARCP